MCFCWKGKAYMVFSENFGICHVGMSVIFISKVVFVLMLIFNTCEGIDNRCCPLSFIF